MQSAELQLKYQRLPGPFQALAMEERFHQVFKTEINAGIDRWPRRKGAAAESFRSDH